MSEPDYSGFLKTCAAGDQMYYSEIKTTTTPAPTKEIRELKLEQQVVEYGASITTYKVKIEMQDKENLRLATIVTRQGTELKELMTQLENARSVIRSQITEKEDLTYTNNKLYDDNKKLRNQDWAMLDDLASKEEKQKERQEDI